MRKLKKFHAVIGILILLAVLFRGMLFRWTVKYQDVGSRADITLTNAELISSIESHSADREMDFEAVVDIAQDVAKEALRFTTERASNDPNQLASTAKANCVSYAALFNSAANYLIAKHHLQGEMRTEHKVGRLYFLGIDLHQFFDSPFFHDHDYNAVTNLKTGDSLAVDPSVSDYLWINSVSQRSN